MTRRAASENVVKLTKANVSALAVRDGQSERVVWDAEVRGFGIRIRSSGNRSWVIRPPRTGTVSKLHTIASATGAGALDLSKARQLAHEKLADVVRGADPTSERREARARADITLGKLADDYIAHKRDKGRRPSTLSNLRHSLHTHWKPLHGRPLSAITRAEVAARHRQLVTECGPHAADRARSVLSTFFVWAMGEGKADHNPVLSTNTATSPARRDRVLSDAELKAIWHACRDDDFGRIVRLLMLTGQRRSEVAGMAKSECNLDDALWTIPKERSKNRLENAVPLSPAALAIVRSVGKRQGSDLLFGDGAGPFSGFSKAKAALDKRLGDTVAEWNLHDLRRTASTRLAELGVVPHVIEAVLHHLSGAAKAGVAGIYNKWTYLPEKRSALSILAAHVDKLVGGKYEAIPTARHVAPGRSSGPRNAGLER